MIVSRTSPIMKYLTLALLVLMNLGLVAQDPDTAGAFVLKSGVLIGGSYQHPTNNQTDLIEPSGSLVYQIQGNLYLPITKKLELRPGIGIARIPVIQKDFTITLGSDIDLLTGIDYYNSWWELDATLLKLIVPIDINFYFHEIGSGLFIGTGASFQVILATNGSLELVESGINTINFSNKMTQTFFRRILVLPEIRLGYDMSLSENIRGSGELFAQYSPQGQLSNQSLHFVQLGVRIGMRWSNMIK